MLLVIKIHGYILSKRKHGYKIWCLKEIKITVYQKKKKRLTFFFGQLKKKRLSLPRLYSVKLDDIWQKSWKIRNIIIITSHG